MEGMDVLMKPLQITAHRLPRFPVPYFGIAPLLRAGLSQQLEGFSRGFAVELRHSGVSTSATCSEEGASQLQLSRTSGAHPESARSMKYCQLPG